MKFVINNKTYDRMDGLTFNPETDLTGDTVPICEFEARLFTNDIISWGQWAELRDDLNNLWARYWLSYAERIGHDVDGETYIVRIIGQSPVTFLDRSKLVARYYDGTPASDVLAQVLADVGNYGFDADSIIPDEDLLGTYGDTPITGFFPEQTARERLQWLMLVVGGYVAGYFSEVLEIRPISEEIATIPLAQTYWKPTVEHRDYVTAIRVWSYTYQQGTPESTDEWVTDGTNTYVQMSNIPVIVRNNKAPAGAPENIVDIEGVTIITPSQAGEIATRLADYYFDRTEINLSAINNHEFQPGQRVYCYADEDMLYSGYIDRCDFEFGVQAKGNFHIVAAAGISGAKLIIIYKFGTMQVARQEFYLPVGYQYSIATEYLDWTMNGHRYIFRPTITAVTGTLPSEGQSVTVQCAIALDQYTEASSGQDTIERLYTDALNQVQAYYDGLYLKAKTDKKKLEIDNALNQDRDRLMRDYTGRMDEEGTTKSVLMIVSVDEVDMEVGVIDEEERTVEIG